MTVRFECYLHTALVNTYRLTETQAAELSANIPIVHVHGSLGRLPWQRGDAKVRPYSTEISPDSVAAARDSIQVIHEGRYDSPSFTEASGLINSADVVVFLGFGYHPTNVARLGIKLDRDCVFYGSAYQLTKSECKTVQRHFNDGLHMGRSLGRTRVSSTRPGTHCGAGASVKATAPEGQASLPW